MNFQIAEKILTAVGVILAFKEGDTFTEVDITEQLAIGNRDWGLEYADVFEGMLTNRPADAADSGVSLRGVFEDAGNSLYRPTAYGQSLLDRYRQGTRASATQVLPRVEAGVGETMDGLRAWQAAIVRFWTGGKDLYMELSLGWLPKDSSDGPWVGRLVCGDHSPDGWGEDIRILKTASPQQSLQRLWDRATSRYDLFKENPVLPLKVPTDFPADSWVTTAERALIDTALRSLQRKAPKTAIRFTYHTDRRPDVRWAAFLHPFNVEPPHGVLAEVNGNTFLQVLNAINRAIESKFKTGEMDATRPPNDKELMELMTRYKQGLQAGDANRQTITDEPKPDGDATIIAYRAPADPPEFDQPTQKIIIEKPDTED
jgi:hypothetical protein